MGAPTVSFTTQDGNTGAVRQSTSGVLAIIAFLASLPTNVPNTFTRVSDIQAAGGLGPGIEYAGYYMTNSGKPVLIINPTCTTTGSYGTIDHSGVLGTATIAASGAPIDDYDVTVQFQSGGTLGTAGITYRYTLDNGNNWSPTIALGTGVTIACPTPLGGTTNVSFTLSTSGSSTILVNDFFRVQTKRPQMQNSDLVTALAALQASQMPWDGVLIDADATSTLVATVDSWLAGLEKAGVYKMAWMNTRHKLTPAPTGETESAFFTFLSTLLNATSTIRIDVGADGGDVPSPVTGLVQVRPTSLAIATRTNGVNSAAPGRDPAYVADGPVPGFKITDASGNPKWHNEDPVSGTPGIDALRLSTLRTIAGEQGVYITNGNILSPAGSDFVYDQHVRTMNVAKTIGFALLTLQLSRGVRKQAPDPTTNQIYILEDDAAAIEGFVNPQIKNGLENQVTDVLMQLARNDDLSANSGGSVHAQLEVESLAYVKNFVVVNQFVKSIIAVTVNN